MAPSSRPDALAALAWLVEAGADEAMGEAPVDRFRSNPPPIAHPPLEGGSKNRSAQREDFSGRGNPPAFVANPSPKMPSAFSTLPQGEGQRSAQAEGGGGDSIATAMEAAAAASTLAELKAALEAFEGSQLKKNATNTVFADGNPESRILFIGEAPGRDEDRLGLPFVGRAGKLLDQMLAAIHLDRSRAYITNVLPWRPPDNRNPEATEVAQCIPFLRRHIELADPGIMILLGAVSVRHVLGLGEGIMKFRGRWMEYRVGDRMVPVMPTLHPAYLLRQPAHKKLAWRDLQAVEEKITALGLNAR
jgi:DNA polymerase